MCVFQNKFKWKKENHLMFLAFLFTTYWQTKLLTCWRGMKPLFVRAFDGSELFKAEHPTKIQCRRSVPVSAYELLTSVKIWCMSINRIYFHNFFPLLIFIGATDFTNLIVTKTVELNKYSAETSIRYRYFTFTYEYRPSKMCQTPYWWRRKILISSWNLFSLCLQKKKTCSVVL